MVTANQYLEAERALHSACLFLPNVGRGLTSRRVDLVLATPVFAELRMMLAEAAVQLRHAASELQGQADLCRRLWEQCEAEGNTVGRTILEAIVWLT